MRSDFALRFASVVRRITWRIGRFERRLSAPRITLVDLAQQLSMSRSDLTLVQIGANDGVRFDPIAELRRRFRLRGVVVEPLSEMHTSLRAAYSAHPDVSVVEAAIHASATEVEIYKVRADAAFDDWMHGIASLSPTHHERLGVPAESMESLRVPAMTLDRLLSGLALDRLDLLVMDCEGYDLDILDMLDLDVWRPAVIQFEHGLAGHGIDGIRLSESLNRLRQAGYESVIGGEDVISYLPACFLPA